MNIHVLFFEKKIRRTSGGGPVDVSEPRKNEPHGAHCGKLFSDSPTAPSDRWPTSPSWTCHEGLPSSFFGGGVHFPTTQVGKTMKTQKTKIIEKKKVRKILSKMTKVHDRDCERSQTKEMDLY